MTRKLIYIAMIIVAMFLCVDLSYSRVYAEDDGSATGPGVFGEGSSDVTLNPDYYKPGSNPKSNPGSPTSATGADTVKNIGNSIIGVLQVIGTILSVAVLAVLGIKYMVGSVEERAEYKKTMMPYLVGAIMVFAITNILAIIANIASGLL